MRSQEWSQSQVQHSSQEIKQDNLKTQLVSAITDLEGDTEMVDFGKENKTIDLMSPPQAKSPTPKAAAFTPTKQVTIVHSSISDIRLLIPNIVKHHITLHLQFYNAMM